MDIDDDEGIGWAGLLCISAVTGSIGALCTFVWCMGPARDGLLYILYVTIGGASVGGVVGTPVACCLERTADVDEATPAKVAAVFIGGVCGIVVGFVTFVHYFAG
jgi:hypothetical protein